MVVLTALCSILTTSLGACRRGEKLPDPSSKEYREAVSAFYVGLAALQTGEDVRAKEKLTLVTQLVPQEPAGWADLGLLALRQQELDVAAERLEKARSLAPQNSQLHVLLGLVESRRGRLAEAISLLRKAIELDPKNLKASYALAQEIERQGDEQSEAEAQRLMEKILETQPNNLAALLELTRLAAKRGEAGTLQKAVAGLAKKADSWPPEVKQQLTALQATAAGPNPRAAASQVAFLRNVLVRVPEYRQSLAAVKAPAEEIGEPFTRFIKLPSPSPSPAPPDDSLTFTGEPIPAAGASQWPWVGSISLNGEGAPAVIVANGREVRVLGGATLGFPGGLTGTPPASNGVLGVDLNYDFKMDLVLTGAGGLRLFQQAGPGTFTDVTSRAGLPATVTGAAYVGAWAADIDLDGDLDLVLGTVDGPPVVIRNNGDGTFKELRLFEGVSKLRDFAWADLDGDGDPDAALLDAEGKLHLFTNERLGQFRTRPVPPNLGKVDALSVADANNDGIPDLIVLQADRTILRLSDKADGREWDVAEIGRRPPELPDGIGAETVRLLAADLDNNGSLDLVEARRAGTWVWLSDGQGKFNTRHEALKPGVSSVADLNGDGRLDLVGLDAGQVVRLVNRGSKNYHWQTLRPRAAKATGDQRINSFGIGGEIEIRAGLLFQKQVITGPLVHFGLGEQTQTDVARIIWPNGSVQAEFELKSDQTILAEQRLKGSCPSLFAFNGEEMAFVKDCAPWSPALGLHINAQVTAGIQQLEEWMKIRGDQLVPRDGYYDLRITAELWETYYVDHYSLLVVDHPAGTDVFTDERFAVPPPKLAIYTVAKPRPVLHAWDDLGQEVTETVRARDERYLDSFGRGQYQGVTRDHYVEVELPAEAPRDGPLWLVAHGWMHPTDGTINIALSQGHHPPPRGLSLEVSDGKGGWVVAKPNLGFPAGKEKTILIDLTGVFQPGTPRRLRLRTNMEIYWDELEWARGLPETELKIQRLSPEAAELRYRGFSVMRRASDSSPELPDYNHVAGTAQRWRDLIGYYTRYGDIRELLAKVDDRFVLVNAGDEMAFRFPALPPPAQGWARDFVLVGHGWIKDGDYNSTFSKTVLPLPAHDLHDYTRAPGRLEDDPVYRRHPQDWQDYHTRYVTPERFQNALRIRE